MQVFLYHQPMTTLTLSGKNIHSLDDVYTQVVENLSLDTKKFGYNLDALYDVLRDSSLESIHIKENTLLKKNLNTIHTGEISEYIALIDLLSDLSIRLIIE